jgi:putative oxidoreductase
MNASRFFILVARLAGNDSVPVTTTVVLELFSGFGAACIALWFISLSRHGQAEAPTVTSATPALTAPQRRFLDRWLRPYLLGQDRWASLGLLLLRLSIGGLMIHHGQEKLADPQQFADTYVASLHLPFQLFFAYVAGFSELVGSWMLILGLFMPVGAFAIAGTMTVAAYQHILTAGLNIYVLELVVLYLGGSLGLLLLGPGCFSFDAGMLAALLRPAAALLPVRVR